MPKLHIYKTEKETCHAFAEWFVQLVNVTLSKQDRFTIALPGGDTAKVYNKILADEFRDKIDWSKIHLFWTNQVFASLTDENNQPVSTDTFIDNVPIPATHVHLISTDLSPAESAKQYDQVLHDYFGGGTTFDLVVLGLREDGYTPSIFTGIEGTNGKLLWAISSFSEQDDCYRISLSSNVINAASTKAFLVTGKRKQDAVERVLKGKYEPEKYPAQLIQTASKTVHWFLDEAAAGKLIKPTL